MCKVRGELHEYVKQQQQLAPNRPFASMTHRRNNKERIYLISEWHCLTLDCRCPMHLHTPSLLFAIKQFKRHEFFWELILKGPACARSGLWYHSPIVSGETFSRFGCGSCLGTFFHRPRPLGAGTKSCLVRALKVLTKKYRLAKTILGYLIPLIPPARSVYPAP